VFIHQEQEVNHYFMVTSSLENVGTFMLILNRSACHDYW